MAIGDIHELTHTMQLFGKPVQNVYFYRAEASGTSAEDLKDAFVQDMLPAIGDIQTDEVGADNIRVITLFNFTDFWSGDVTPPARGTQTDTLPRINAINFTLRTNVRNIGPGSKRYAGLSASFTDDNVVDDATMLGLLNALRLKLQGTIGVSANTDYQPVIVKRVFYAATPTAKAGYYLPKTLAELEYADITQAAISLDISSQVSRK